jgi:hypothetical protein
MQLKDGMPLIPPHTSAKTPDTLLPRTARTRLP